MIGPCYIVLGPPRTGTSLTMGILTKLGVDGGDDWRTGPSNVHYYEHRLVLDFINDKCSAADMLAAIEKPHAWGMKHPTLAKKWEQLRNLIDDPRFIITHRRDFQAQFLSHRKAIRRQSKESLVERTFSYYKTVDFITAGKPRTDVYFEDWFSSPDRQIEAIYDIMCAPKPDIGQVAAALKMIDPKQKHH